MAETRGELARVEPSEDEKKHVVYKHVDYPHIRSLLIRGKEPKWVAKWLAARYPLEDKNGIELDEAEENRRMHLSPGSIERYREKFLPETLGNAPIGVVNEELEELIGLRLPAPVGVPWELDVLDTIGIPAAQVNLKRAMAQDEEMEMLNPVTMDAQGRLVDTLARSIELKSRLGLAGYEAAPERQHVVTENSHHIVELHGRLDRDGKPQAVEVDKVEMARKLLDASPEERTQILDALRMAEQPVIESTAVEGESDTVAEP